MKKGSLKNGRRFPKKGTNFKYFSKLTYFIDNRAWVHEKVCMATLEAYKICEQMMPERKFMIMECSHRKGGKMFPHRTHQNGTSIDFASPLTKNNTLTMETNGKVFGIMVYNLIRKVGVCETKKYVLILKIWQNIYLPWKRQLKTRAIHQKSTP